MQRKFKILNISQLQRGKYQPRKMFDEQSLKELADSIQSQGLIEPLIVRELATNRYEIIAGERRWRAAMLAELTEIPCLIGEYNDEQTAAITLIENIQRADLNLIEEATGYQRLINEFRFSQDQIATLVGKSRSHIANILRLLTLCDEIQTLICNQQLSLGHARMLVGLDPKQQSQLGQLVVTEHWSVRQLEQAVRLGKQPVLNTPLSTTDCDRIHLETALADYMGTPVEITSDSERGGVLKIRFFDNDTLSGILERIGMRYD
ncbi:MAG: ParB/RepB/Spo0J family partition protein [Legionellaceae bacterium]|nr:ParB/RepB/Spo0J family partition protein [Legionellaceae bacterium]